VGQRKGPSGANAPPVHGIKKCLDPSSYIVKKCPDYIQIFKFLIRFSSGKQTLQVSEFYKNMSYSAKRKIF
jgi:hypothetical protein